MRLTVLESIWSLIEGTSLFITDRKLLANSNVVLEKWDSSFAVALFQLFNGFSTKIPTVEMRLSLNLPKRTQNLQ